MKRIILKVKIEVPDDYQLNEESWLLDDACRGIYEVVEINQITE